MTAPYKPVHTREELEKYFKQHMYKKTYDRFSWWRMYTPKNNALPKRSPLIDKVLNGDYEFSHYKLQAEWVEHDLNDLHEMYYPDVARYVEEASVQIARRKRLMEDHWKEEDRRLDEIRREFNICFKISLEDLEKEMEEFSGGLKDFYYLIDKKYGQPGAKPVKVPRVWK